MDNFRVPKCGDTHASICTYGDTNRIPASTQCELSSSGISLNHALAGLTFTVMSLPLIRMLPSPRFITIRTFVNAKSSPGLPPHVNLTPQTLSLHKVESTIHTSMSNKCSAIERHAKLLMLAGVTKLPMHLINRLKWDLGPPHDIVGTLVDDFSDYSGAFEVGMW
ncbi:hypothetical protein CerSpe_063330 [Prunus speciosa]